MASPEVDRNSESREGHQVTENDEQNEYQLRRRRIAKVFMEAYGSDIIKLGKKVDPKKLEELQRKREEEAKPVSPYNLQNLLWILGTLGIFFYTDFVPAILNDTRVRRTWLYVGFGFIGVNISIALYLIIVCSWIKKIQDWEKYSPTAIPIATCSFVTGTICVNIGMWPVYGFLTPVMLFTIFMGFVVVVSLLPNSW